VNRSITHLRKLRDTRNLVEEFYRVAGESLKEKLGCVLFQLPPSYRFSDENLERLLNQLNPNFRNVVEFRHRSWWCRDVWEALGKAGVVFCSVSAPGLPEDLVETASAIYIRFHGVSNCLKLKELLGISFP